MKKSTKDGIRMPTSDGTSEPVRTHFEAVRNRLTKVRSPLETIRIQCEQVGGHSR
jgi:hypothetical protein